MSEEFFTDNMEEYEMYADYAEETTFWEELEDGDFDPEDFDEEDELVEGKKCSFPKGSRRFKGCNRKRQYCSISGCPHKKGVQRGTCVNNKPKKGMGGTKAVECNGKSYGRRSSDQRAGVNVQGYKGRKSCRRSNAEIDGSDLFEDDDKIVRE